MLEEKQAAQQKIKAVRGRDATVGDIKKMYRQHPSITTLLPWMAFDDDSKTLVLEDGVSRAAIYQLDDISTEILPDSEIEMVRDGLMNLLSEVFPQEVHSPWHVQFYIEADRSLSSHLDEVKNSIEDHARGSQFTESYLKLLEEHLELLSMEGGIFKDRVVSGLPFYGNRRRVYCVFYRRLTRKVKFRAGNTPLRDINSICVQFEQQLETSKIKFKRLAGAGFYEWMLKWLSPRPPFAKDTDEILKAIPYPDEENRPFGYDFVENFFNSEPVSDAEEGVWFFDKRPHKFVTIENLTNVPKFGHLSAEIPEGSSRRNSLFEKLPENSVFCINMVILNQQIVEARVKGIKKSAVGNKADSRLTSDECDYAEFSMKNKNYLFPCVMGVFIEGNDLDEIYNNEIKVASVLRNNGFKPIKSEYDFTLLDSYIRNLPAVFDYGFDQKNTKRSGLVYLRQIANLLPLYGRYKGTGHSMLIKFNRGGELQTYDPYVKDKIRCMHRLTLGPTGSGKSANAVDELMSIMALLRPYLFIIDAGNSFGLLMQYFKAQGLTTHDVVFDESNPVPLNPYAASAELVQRLDVEKTIDVEQVTEELEKEIETASQREKSDAEEEETQGESKKKVHRDLLGELVIATLLMITGGEEKEEREMSRHDRQVVTEIVIDSARAVYNKDQNRQMLVEDVVEGFNRRIQAEHEKGQYQDAVLLTRLNKMRGSLAYFTTDTLSNKFFNQPSEYWPEVDATRLELGDLKESGYEAQMGLSVMSLISMITAFAERNQFSGRPILVVIDECHVITTNPITCVSVTKISKMGRKCNLGLWMITQNLKDFPGESRKMLTQGEMNEFLVDSHLEMKEILDLFPLTDKQKEMMASLKKQPRGFTEGLIVSEEINGVFRNVPPRLVLALSQTDPDEKRNRRRLMEEKGVTELEAVYEIAEGMINSVQNKVTV